MTVGAFAGFYLHAGFRPSRRAMTSLMLAAVCVIGFAWAPRIVGDHIPAGPSLTLGGTQATFTPHGVQLRIGGGTFSMSLERIGRGDRRQETGDIAPTRAAGQVRYDRPAVSEWYQPGPGGLEQGFTLTHRQLGSARLPLSLALSTAGSLHLMSTRVGSSALLISPTGRVAGLYGALRVTDASGLRCPPTSSYGAARC